MIAGLQCFNDAGGFQIDGVYPQFVLRRKIVVTTDAWTYGERVGYSTVAVSIAGDEVVALASSVACAVTFKQGTLLRLVSLGGVGTVITVYVFGPITSASPGGMGLQVYNGAGSIVFDSAQKPLVMIGFPVGEGNFTYNGGRSYAAICINQYLTVQDTRIGSGGYETQLLKATQGMVKTIAGGVNVSNLVLYDTTNYFDPGQTDLDRTIPAGTPNRHVIVDITYY